MDRTKRNAHSKPSAYFAGESFKPEIVESRFPNARGHLQGGLFISHAGRDYRRIQEDLVDPVIYERFGPNGYFLHNRGSGKAEGYVQLVLAALHYCDKFIVVVSSHSITNEWVAAEVDWAVENGRPIIACLFDDSNPADLHPDLAKFSLRKRRRGKVYTVDFRHTVERGQQHLATLLEKLPG